MGNLVGKTLGYAARKTGLRRGGWRVYCLDGEQDSTGTLCGEDYSLARILQEYGELRRWRVISVEDYFGLMILRVRRPG